MPIEIKELVLRAVVVPQEPGSSDGSVHRPGPAPKVDERAIVQAAVKQVLRVLKRQRER